MNDEPDRACDGRDDEIRSIVEFLTSGVVVGKSCRAEEDRRVDAGYVNPPWSWRDLALVLPIGEARAMWARAEQLDVERGGRFDVRLGALILWTKPSQGRHEPIGTAYILWHTPTDAEATISQIEWDGHHGGTEEDVWQGLELLSGRSLRSGDWSSLHGTT